MIRSVKGRLQYVVRNRVPKAFQRNYCMRSIGTAIRRVVEEYVADQLGHHVMADQHVQQRLARFQKKYPGVDLSVPCFSSHGEFWCNLHVVIVNDQRWAEVREVVLGRMMTTIERTAATHGDRISRLGLLADQFHLTIGCPIDRSPQAIALAYLNNGAYVREMKPVFKFGYYVGTIGEYDRGAVT